jgi:Tol biopolymer transport system component
LAGGGEPKPITKLQGPQTTQWFPSFLPDGNHFLFADAGTGDRNIFVGSLESVEARRLLAADSAAVYAPPGYLLFVRQGTLLAQPFDPNKLELTGEAVAVAEQVAFDAIGRGFSVSEGGTLEYRTGSGRSDLRLVWVDRSGKVIESVGVPAVYQSPAISPDGKHIAVHRHEDMGGDVWIVETSGGKTSRLTFDTSQENSQPLWSTDGSHIVFGSHRNGKWGIYRKLSNGTSNDELLFESDALKMPMSWSAAANTILFWVADSKTSSDVWALPLSGDRKPFPVLQTAFTEAHPQISPDGKWFAYYSNETGRYEIYVQSFPPGRGKWQISGTGGVFPRWRSDGRSFSIWTPSA